jgi:hypothetical protein
VSNGVIASIESINVCDDLMCSNNKCVNVDEAWNGTYVEESVRRVISKSKI